MTPGDAATVGRLVPSHNMSLWAGSRQPNTSSSTPALGTPQETQPASRLSPWARLLALKHHPSVSSDSSSLPQEGVVLRGAPQWLPGSTWGQTPGSSACGRRLHCTLRGHKTAPSRRSSLTGEVCLKSPSRAHKGKTRGVGLVNSALPSSSKVGRKK